MHRIARFRVLLLAIMVMVSHVALLSHAAAHFMPNLDQCELCVSQAHPLAAIPSAESALSGAPPTGNAPAAISMPSPPVAPACAYQQRAPPQASS